MAFCTSVALFVNGWVSAYSGDSPASLNWATAKRVSAPRLLTPLTIARASAFACAIVGPIEPVVSIAISTSAFGGLTGTPTVFVSVAVPSVASPGRSVNTAEDGDSIANATVVTTAAVAASAATTSRIRLVIFPPSERPPETNAEGAPTGAGSARPQERRLPPSRLGAARRASQTPSAVTCYGAATTAFAAAGRQ